MIIVDIFGVRKGLWLQKITKKNKRTKNNNYKERKKERKEREKSRIIRRQNYLARKVLLYVELLGNNAFRAPIAEDLLRSPRYNLMLCPSPQSAAFNNNNKKERERLAGEWVIYLLGLGHPRDEGAKGGG